MIKFLTSLLLIFFTLIASSEINLIKETEPIVAEGKLLYKSEMASWRGTDLFIENYKDRDNIGGYFSYTEAEITKCIFFSSSEKPIVIGTITFDSTFNTNTAKIDLKERSFSEKENDLYDIRKIALNELTTNTDDFFKFYENTNPNIIPLIKGKEKKVYILTGPQISGVVIFGNDYLLTFNKKNKLTEKKELHKNIIPVEYGESSEEGKEIVGAMHSHQAETGYFITATDICTLMLYGKIAGWKTHNVVSKKYLNIWNCETEELTVIPMSTLEKINETQEKNKKTK